MAGIRYLKAGLVGLAIAAAAVIAWIVVISLRDAVIAMARGDNDVMTLVRSGQLLPAGLVGFALGASAVLVLTRRRTLK